MIDPEPRGPCSGSAPSADTPGPTAHPPADDPAADDRAALVVGAVRAHRPGDEREALSRSIFLAELARLDRPFDEEADLTHITASAIVVGPRGVVLHLHRRLHRWMQPGGHVEAGESPSDAALRECVEETGLPVAHPEDGPTLVHLDVHTAARDHVHLDLRYLVLGSDVAPHPGPGESPEVAWFSWEAALDMADDSLTGGLRSARTLVRASAARAGVPQVDRREDS
jgi:8-oxo-dGTP pyrophosphatase MutT (NUDIX family)